MRYNNRDLWLGDLDKDRIPNIDDKYPFSKTKREKVNKEVSLSKAFKGLESRQREYKKDIKVLSSKINADSYRVKDIYSSIGKQIGRNIGTLEDAGGLRILAKNRKDVYNRVNKIKKKFPKCSKTRSDNCVKQVEDKYKTNKKNNFQNPYMGVHVNLKYRGKPYEVQIKCHKQQPLHEKMHRYYKQGNFDKLRKLRVEAISLYKKGC